MSKRAISEFLREMDREEQQQRNSDFAEYRTNMTKEQLKQVLDYHQKDPGYANLPKKSGLVEEIQRWNTSIPNTKLKNAKRDELITMLCQAIGHTPRRRAVAKRYHRFGLSFTYNGAFPSPKYKETMSSEELKAMLELYPNPKITNAELKDQLRKYGEKLTGGKPELLHRLQKCLGCKDLSRSHYSYTDVKCWEDERAALQAKYDKERDEWRAEIQGQKENAVHFSKATNDRKAIEDTKQQAKKQRKEDAASRPWCAKPYNPTAKSQSEVEAIWKRRFPQLSFPYSGSMLPPPESFSDVLADYETDKSRNCHHLLAYLEKGYGTFHITARDCYHSYMSKDALKRIHGRQCTGLGTSHSYALEVVRQKVAMTAAHRYKNSV